MIDNKDIHFMKEARLVAEMSHCLSRKIGSVLVRDGHRIASGYNGPAKGITHCEWRDDKGDYSAILPDNTCPRQRLGYKSGEGMEHCPAVHAEINSILMAARFGIATEGTTLYCWCRTPCADCSKEIINAGIKRIVCLGNGPREYRSTGISATRMLEEAGVEVEYIEEEEFKNG